MSSGKANRLLFNLILLVFVSTFVEGNADLVRGEYMVVTTWAGGDSPNKIQSPRGILVDPAGDILIVSNQHSTITALFSSSSVNGSATSVVIVDDASLGLNHGIAYNANFLYASSSSTVYRWPYRPGQRAKILANVEKVVTNIPANGLHQTRSLIFDQENNLYVSIGSRENVDQDSSRAGVRRFDFKRGVPANGISFDTGVVVASGLRNAVGLEFDENGNLWGVSTGADSLYRADLGNDIHIKNPADVLIKFNKEQTPSQFYGYPFCWTVYELANYNKKDSLAWPDFMNDEYNDAWCRNPSNNKPPTLALPAHYTPLGLTFYDGKNCDNIAEGAFPCFMKGHAFVAFRGSSNILPPYEPVGYKVVRIPIDNTTGLPKDDMLDIVAEPDRKGCRRNGDECFRPVDLAFDHNGHLIVTADTRSEVLRITYNGPDYEELPTTLPVTNPTSGGAGPGPGPTPSPNSSPMLQQSISLMGLMTAALVSLRLM